MSERLSFERLAELHVRKFEQADRNMPEPRAKQIAGWMITHPGHEPRFADRLNSAVKWTKENPERFQQIVGDFNAALNLLNGPLNDIDPEMFPNIIAYRAHRKGMLPLVGNEGKHNPREIIKAAKDSGIKLRYGETIQPGDEDYYGYHNYVKSDAGMVAASMTDLYENYTRVLGLYPEDAHVDGALANAITEAAYLVDPNSELFSFYKIPEDGWIHGYDGFSPKFQEAVYGSAVHLHPDSH